MNDGSSPTSWIALKEQGKHHYENARYEEALQSYRAALATASSTTTTTIVPNDQEQQLLLSNIVACRLQIGGSAQASAAVWDAKRCIELNPSYAKGHVRLASAYIALGGHSNQACNSLQTALRLDPRNAVARQMLLQELRRDHRAASESTASRQGVSSSFGRGVNADLDDTVNGSDNYRARQNGSGRNTSTTANAYHDIDVGPLSFSDRLQFRYAQCQQWYHQQSDVVQTALKILAVFLALYILFGGRFGLDTLFQSSSQKRGNYGRNNAYSDFYRHTKNSYGSGGSNSYGGSNRYGYDSSSYGGRRDSHGGSSSYFGGGNLMDGGLPSMLLVGAGAYGCYLLGINPLHLLWILRFRGGGFGRRRGYGGGYYVGGRAGMFGRPPPVGRRRW